MCKHFERGTVFEITIGNKAFVTKDKLKNTIIHELLHTLAPYDGHTGKWKRMADVVNHHYNYNIKRCSSFSELVKNDSVKLDTFFNYMVECQDCGYIIGYNNRSKLVKNPEFYRCGKCKGEFKRIK